MSLSIATHGHDCVIGAVIVQALKAQIGGDEAEVLDNPTRASLLEEGLRKVVFEDQGNRRSPDAQKKSVRIYSFSVATLCRTTEARTDAHALYQVARRVVMGILPALTAAGVAVTGNFVSEGDVTYRLEGIEVGGGLVVGLFTLEYNKAGG